MDKILITSFKDNIASAILNSQGTNKNLNFNTDGYIDAEELPGVLEFFGETDVNKLLKQPQNSSDNSVFTNEEQTEDFNQKPEKSAKLTKEESKQYTELMDSDNAVLRNDGSAAYELQNTILSDLMTESTGTPFAAQMKSLIAERKALVKNGLDASEVETKINAINKVAQEYIKLHQKDITKILTENDLIKTFNYGENGEKTGYYVQTLSLKGNNTSGGSSESDNVSDKEKTDDENQESENKRTVGGVTYNIELVTDKVHAIGSIDADSENSDVAAAVVYNTKLKNGGKLDFAGNFRQTIEKNNNETKFGGAIDYISDNFSTGAYCSYQSGERDNVKTSSLNAEAYGKYKKSLRAAVGYSKKDTVFSTTVTKYASAKVSGKRELENSNLTLTGSIEGVIGVGSMTMDDYKDILPMQMINANGGLAFKSSHSDFSANVLGNLNIEREKNVLSGYETVVTSTLLGNASTEKVDVTATLTAANYPEYKFEQESQEVVLQGRKMNWSSSITLGIKKIFGPNVIPSVTYNISSDNEVKHNFLVNMGVNF